MGKNKSKKHHKKTKRICKTIKNIKIHKKKISGGGEPVSGGQSVAEWFYGMFDKMMGKKKEPETGVSPIVPTDQENLSFEQQQPQSATGVSQPQQPQQPQQPLQPLQPLS